jgi:hypothetical protein
VPPLYRTPEPVRREALRAALFATVVPFILLSLAGVAFEHTLEPALLRWLDSP